MSKKYIQILELASSLSRDECIMLIKDISTALVENEPISQEEQDQEILKKALLTRAKVKAGEMKTWSLEEAKIRINAGK